MSASTDQLGVNRASVVNNVFASSDDLEGREERGGTTEATDRWKMLRYPYGDPTQIQGGNEEIRFEILYLKFGVEKRTSTQQTGPQGAAGRQLPSHISCADI
ncbi:hypothetical protein O3P69_001608 [Scylla paramamosain]|uniref:Uncharacterized protein n=1 Tax=Scylla paramamosain TaxID=85552 RepID=A0AAW0UYF0_SCYPA